MVDLLNNYTYPFLYETFLYRIVQGCAQYSHVLVEKIIFFFPIILYLN